MAKRRRRQGATLRHDRSLLLPPSGGPLTRYSFLSDLPALPREVEEVAQVSRRSQYLVPPPAKPRPRSSALRGVQRWFRVLGFPFGSVRSCLRRGVRRRVMFAIRKAGFGRRRSPGRFGGYRRNVDSSYPC